MWILVFSLIGLGIFITLIIVAYKSKNDIEITALVMIGCIVFIISSLTPIAITKSQPDSPYNYKADIENYNTAYFTTYSQEGNCVVIPDHYTYDGWLMKLEYHDKPLLIKIPEGKSFKYTNFRTEPIEKQHVVNDCSEP